MSIDSQANTQPQLIMMIGLPGSGKSFLAQQLLKLHPSYHLISTDAIRAQLFGHESIQGPWLAIFTQIKQQFQQAVTQTAGAIYDATNAQRRHRRDLIQLARESGFNPIIGIWVQTSVEQCLQRNQHRSRQVPQEIILKMHRQLCDAPPSLTDGLDRLLTRQT
ncbi:MAG: AAA family ATPase [Microcoleaceae cyanobacterium]